MGGRGVSVVSHICNFLGQKWTHWRDEWRGQCGGAYNDPEGENKVMRHQLESGIWMRFGQLDQDKEMEVEAETMLWGPDYKDSFTVEHRMWLPWRQKRMHHSTCSSIALDFGSVWSAGRNLCWRQSTHLGDWASMVLTKSPATCLVDTKHQRVVGKKIQKKVPLG